MADSTIGSLPAASALNDSSLLVVEQLGAAMKLTGLLLKQYVQNAVQPQVDTAEASADAAAVAQEGAEAARNAIEGMTVSGVTLDPSLPVKVEKTIVDGVVHLTFSVPSGKKGDKGDPREVLQDIGQSTEAVMSQKAVTDCLESKVEKPTSVSGVARLYGVGINRKDTVFFQVQTSNPYKDSIPKRGANGTFAVGTPTNPTDAVNKEYVVNKLFRQKYISTLALSNGDAYEPTATDSSSIISIVCTSGDVFIMGVEGENYANLSCNDQQNPPFATITAIGNQIMIQTGFISTYDIVYGGETCNVTTKFAPYGDFLSHTTIPYLFVSTNNQATIDIFRGE